MGSVREVSKPVKKRSRGDGRRERWNEHRQARRAEFIEAAMRAIESNGADVGMDEIAAEAGVSKPVLYRHFHDKGDLHTAVGTWASELLLDELAPVIIEEGTPNERIRRIVGTYLEFIERHPDLYRFVVHRHFADRPISTDPVAEEKTVIAGALARLIGSYMRAFSLDSGGVEAWSHGLVGMVQASGEWWLDRKTMSRDDLTSYLTEIIWFAVDGVLRRGGIVLDPDQPLDLEPPRPHAVPDPQPAEESAES